MVCEIREQASVCVNAEDAPLVIGQSAPISGTNQALGIEMKLGIDLAFNEKNAAGGIRGRMLKLVFRDDGYQPNLAEEAVRELVSATESGAPPKCPTTANPTEGGAAISQSALERGPNSVLALLGNVGTPTMERAAPVAVETGTLFFGAFTGATTILRDQRAAGCGRFIFNVRASYHQEARATMEYFRIKGVKDQRHLMSFDQSDSFGQSGYEGLVTAYKALFPGPLSGDPQTPIARFRYTRNDDQSVPAQGAMAIAYLTALLSKDAEVHDVGIMLTSTYGASAEFIRELRQWQYAADTQQQTLNKATRLRLHFSNVSFVGPNALAQKLLMIGPVASASGPRPLTEDVVVSQVVPNYQDNPSELVTAYNRLIAASGSQPSFTSLEGYITARVFIAGLETHKGPFRPDGLVNTFEQLPSLNLGVGGNSGFSATNHQYSNTVWGTAINPDGTFSNLYVWSAGVPIELFE